MVCRRCSHHPALGGQAPNVTVFSRPPAGPPSGRGGIASMEFPLARARGPARAAIRRRFQLTALAALAWLVFGLSNVVVSCSVISCSPRYRVVLVAFAVLLAAT